VAQDQGGALKRGAWLCFLDESGCSLRPPVRRTWAPRGQTPILRHRGHWKRASMAGICCYQPDGSRARLCFHTQPDSYNDHTLIGVLKQLRRFLRGAPVTLIWDNLPAHHSRVMGAWLQTQCHWLQVEYLPGYAHDLDPVEGLWATSRMWSWPTSAATPSPRSPRPPAKGSPGSAESPRCCSRFCGTANWSCEKMNLNLFHEAL
jgi:hypothetical protein